MINIKVNLRERSYPIFIGVKLEGLGKFLRRTLKLSKNALVVTNPTVGKLYLPQVSRGLKDAGFNVNSAELPDGEKYKTLASAGQLYGTMLKTALDRRSPVIALGGGVVGDTAGFAAATFMRGLPLIQVPTTLLAMVDSSVGGKTGVDLKEGKNLIGSFYQPAAVWIDVSTLETLPQAQVENGMAEVIKYGVIKDPALFSMLEKLLSRNFGISGWEYGKIIRKCCAIKASVVEKDEFERKGLREILNFGHTFGHAIEAVTGYSEYLHGEAVAIGMSMASALAVELKIFKASEAHRLDNLLLKAGLEVCGESELSKEDIINSMLRDKKTLGGKIRLVLPVKIGKVAVKSGINPDKIAEVIGSGGNS